MHLVDLYRSDLTMKVVPEAVKIKPLLIMVESILQSNLKHQNFYQLMKRLELLVLFLKVKT